MHDLKTTTCFRTAAAILVLLIFTTASRAGQAQTVRLTSGDWPPYTGKNLPGFGIMPRIISQAFAIKGIAVDYMFVDSWSRAYVLAQKGKCDGSLAWAVTPERKKDFYFSAPVAHHDYVFFHLKETPFHWETLEDLKPYRISTTRSYFYGSAFENMAKKGVLRVFETYEDKAHFRDLIQGRIDIFPMDRNVGFFLRDNGAALGKAAQITHHPRPLISFTTGIVISKAIHPERAKALLEAFDQGLMLIEQKARTPKSVVLQPDQ